MDERLLTRIEDNYVQLAPELLEPLLQFLGTARETSGADVDKLMIMMVVALRTIRHPVFKSRTVAEVLAEDALVPTLGINTRSLADSLPIPRETVRRKVNELIAAQWLVRDGRTLHFTAEAARGLAPVRAKLIRLAACHYEALAPLTAREPRFPGAAGRPNTAANLAAKRRRSDGKRTPAPGSA